MDQMISKNKQKMDNFVGALINNLRKAKQEQKRTEKEAKDAGAEQGTDEHTAVSN